MGVILADGPTGNLDEDTAGEIAGILGECARRMGKCVIMVPHSNELAKRADVVLRLKKGSCSRRKKINKPIDAVCGQWYDGPGQF